MAPTNSPFPIEVLPEVMQNFVCEASDSIGCHPSYVALPLIASLARAIGNKRTIRISPTWTEPAIIWGAVISESGDLKTPAQAIATKFLRAEQDRHSNNSAEPITYVSSDVTFPALRDCLAGQPDSSLLLVPDELVEVLHSLGSRGQSALKKGHWLSCWSATRLTVHRYGRTVDIPRASVSIVGGIQPTAFRDAIKGEHHLVDGMCARFLLTWQSPKQPSQWTTKHVKPSTQTAMRTVFRRLVDLPVDADDTGQYVKPLDIPLTDMARREWVLFYNRHNKQAFKFDHDLKAAWKKLEAYAARFALIMQLATWASKRNDSAGKHIKISAVTMRRAIKLTEWFKQEAKRTYSLFGESAEEGKRRELVDLIKRNKGSITARELMRKSSRYNTEPKASAALSDLAKHKLATWKSESPGKQGGRPTRRLLLRKTPTK